MGVSNLEGIEAWYCLSADAHKAGATDGCSSFLSTNFNSSCAGILPQKGTCMTHSHVYRASKFQIWLMIDACFTEAGICLHVSLCGGHCLRTAAPGKSPSRVPGFVVLH